MSIEEQIQQAVAKAIQPLLELLQNQQSQSNHQKPVLTLEEAMEILGVGKNRMYEIVKTDGFPAFREGKRWMIITHKFYDWMEKQAEKSYRRDLVEAMLVESSLSLFIVAVVIVSVVGGAALFDSFEKLINENEQLKQENQQLRKVKRI